MSILPLIAIGIVLALLLTLVAVFAIYRRQGEMPETDYRVFFIMGLTWLPLGLVFDNPGLWGMGAVFLIVGLTNRDKWKEGW